MIVTMPILYQCSSPGFMSRSCCGTSQVAVKGDMFELGSYEKEGHWMVGQYTVHTGMDVLLTIGERARWIAEGAREAEARPKTFMFHRSDGSSSMD